MFKQPPERAITPDYWQVIHLDNAMYRILSAWDGTADDWRLSSNITHIDDGGPYYTAYTASGSSYHLHKDRYMLTYRMCELLQRWEQADVTMCVVPLDTLPMYD